MGPSGVPAPALGGILSLRTEGLSPLTFASESWWRRGCKCLSVLAFAICLVLIIGDCVNFRVVCTGCAHAHTDVAVPCADLHHHTGHARIVLASSPAIRRFPLKECGGCSPVLWACVDRAAPLLDDLPFCGGFSLFNSLYEGDCGCVSAIGPLDGVIERLRGNSCDATGGLAVVPIGEGGEEFLDGIGVAFERGAPDSGERSRSDLFGGDSERQAIERGAADGRGSWECPPRRSAWRSATRRSASGSWALQCARPSTHKVYYACDWWRVEEGAGGKTLKRRVGT